MRLFVDARHLSPYALSAYVALTEKNLPFDLVEVDLDAGGQRDPAFAATSLTRRVPTLEHEGFSLSESSAIAEYLEDCFPQTPVYPRDRLMAGAELTGPALVEEHASTTVVAPGDALRVDDHGNLVMTIGSDRR